MKLYDYFRSSASYRVRIALHLKNLPYEKQSIALLEQQQTQTAYLKINKQALVPALTDHGAVLTQSLAIIEYLDSTYPHPPLLPKNQLAQAHVRSLAFYIACEMHPLNNLRVKTFLKDRYQWTEEAILDWCAHWLKAGFQSLESQLKQTSEGLYCFGNQVTLADLCLIPQVYSAQRIHFDFQPFPLIQAIFSHCMELKAFKQAHPAAP